MNTQNYNFRIDLVKSSDEFNKIYEKEDFSINATTKEQYLVFKQYLKQYIDKYGDAPHHIYVAYYMFKHRIGCDFENGELVDNLALHNWLDNEIIIKCWKMLWCGKCYQSNLFHFLSPRILQPYGLVEDGGVVGGVGVSHEVTGALEL